MVRPDGKTSNAIQVRVAGRLPEPPAACLPEDVPDGVLRPKSGVLWRTLMLIGMGTASRPLKPRIDRNTNP